MPISDFDGALFWPGIKQFVIDAGIEPISVGEPEDEIWRKIFAADAATDRTLSMGMDSGALMRATYALALGTGGGSAPEVDDLPDALNFSPVTDAARSTSYTSNTLTISGLSSGLSVPVSFSSGLEFSINGGSFGTTGSVANGDTLTLEADSSSASDAVSGFTGSVGSRSVVWTITTVDDLPSALVFTATTGATASTQQTSNTVTVAGLASGYAAVVLADAATTFSKNGGAYGTSTTVVNGDTLTLRRDSAAVGGATVQSTLYVGAGTYTWPITTALDFGANKWTDPLDASTSAYSASTNITRSAANAVTGPDGELSAESIREVATFSGKTLRSTSTSTVNGTTYSYFVDVKPVGRDWFCIELPNQTYTRLRQWYNLTGAGSLGTKTFASEVTTRIVALANGYYRCFVEGLVAGSAASQLPYMWACASDNVLPGAFLGEVTKGFDFYQGYMIVGDNFAGPPTEILLVDEDYPLLAASTTGSMSAGSSTLTVASTTGFAVDDYVIVEIGGEAGGGLRGTTGVGGQWPTVGYTQAAMNANPTPAGGANSWAYITDGADINRVYRRSADNATWERRSDAQYHFNTVQPKSLVAKITAISGLDLTLDRTATVATTGATVYRDNQPAFACLGLEPVGDNIAVRLAAGDYAMSGQVTSTGRVGWRIVGAGKALTTLRTPKGVSCTFFSLTWSQTAEVDVVSDMKLVGNWGDHGYGNDFTGGHYSDNLNTGFPLAIRTVGNGNCIRNVDFEDVSRSWASQYSANTWSRDCTTTINYVLQQYMQWHYLGDNSTGGSEDCTVNAVKYTGSFEGFRCDGWVIRDCGGINACMSMNTSANFLIERYSATYTAGGQQDNPAWSRLNPLININSNAGGASTVNGVISDFTLIVEAAMNNAGELPKGININAANDGVDVTGTYTTGSVAGSPLGLISYPGVGANDLLGQGIICGGPNLTVSGVRVKAGSNNVFFKPISATGANTLIEDTIADAINNSGSGSTGQLGTNGNITNAAAVTLGYPS